MPRRRTFFIRSENIAFSRRKNQKIPPHKTLSRRHADWTTLHASWRFTRRFRRVRKADMSLIENVQEAIIRSMTTSRRRFLANTTLGLGAFGLLQDELAAADSPKAPSFLTGQSRMKLGTVTYDLAKDWNIETIIKNCAEAKFEGVELRTTHAHGVEVALNKQQRAEVKKRFADSSVLLWSLGSAFDYHTPDQGKLRKDIEATKEYILLAHDVGATGVKVRPNGLPKEVSLEKTLEQIGKSLQELGKFAADYGQQIRLEVHGFGTSHLPHIRKMMDIASHPLVGVCWNSN